MTKLICADEDCDRAALARGMCQKHYAAWSRPYKLAGLPLPPKPARVTGGRPPCSIEGCGNKSAGRGWCAKHYWHWQQYGDPLKGAEHKPKPACAADDCDDPADSKGYCPKHYTRWRRYGDPATVKVIVGDDRARFESYVDRSGGPDACHPWTGSQCTGGYGQMQIAGHLKLVHIVAWEFEHGEKPPVTDIDHECHNKAVRDGLCQPGICAHRLCCNEAHLVSRTRQEHADATGAWVHPKGSGHGMAKLNEDQVQEIRRLLAARVMTQTRIASLYGVGPNVISRIKLGKIWGWLPQSEADLAVPRP